MFKIGAFSKLTQVSIRMLRYYDEAGLLKPAEVDPATGYRLYTASQIPRLNRILFLRDLSFNVAEIAESLKALEEGNTPILEALEHKEADIQKERRILEDQLARIALAKKDLQQETIGIHYSVKVKPIPGYQVFSLRRIVKSYYDEGALWKEMARYADEHQLHLSQDTQTFTIYHDTDYREEDLDIEVCAPVEKTGPDDGDFSYRKVPAVPLMACTMVYGHFENISGVFLAMADWLSVHNQYEMAGETRQIVHRGPWNEADPEQFLTEIQIPLKEKRRG